MDPRRPDRGQWLDSLGLDGDPDVFEVLARSRGRRSGDTLEVIALPPTAGPVTLTFLLHGVRHVLGDKNPQATVGDKLRLIEDPHNPHNSRALLVATGGSQRLGYVPDVLLVLVPEIRRSGDCAVRLVRANPDEADPHMRFLVRVRGTLPEDSSWFESADWLLASDRR